MHCRHVFIAHVVTLPNGPHKKKMMTVIQRDGAIANGDRFGFRGVNFAGILERS